MTDENIKTSFESEAPIESEAPVENSVVPVENAAAPAESETPAENVEAPAENIEAPAENVEAPAENIEAPVKNEKPAESETPVRTETAAVKKPVDEIAAEEKAEEAILKANKEMINIHLNELKASVAKMTENEVKNKSNQLRNVLERDEKALKSIFRELKNQRTDGDEFKKKRDELNVKVRELSDGAQENRAKRDAVNLKIAALKSERDAEMEKTKSKTEEMTALKAKRDEYNKTSKGTYDQLIKHYAENLKKFLEDDINLDHEKNLFERLSNLNERVSATKEANDLHDKIREIYNDNKGAYTRSDELSVEIKQLSEESQKYHLEMIETYRKVDDLRKEADGYHRRLTEKYNLIKPTTSKIDPLKKSIAVTRKELDVYLERMKDFQNEKDEKRIDKVHTAAKEKLKQNSRLSLEDLGALIEKGDIDFKEK